MTAAAASGPVGSPSPQGRRPKKNPAAVAAREAEANDGIVVVEHRGLSLRIPVKGKRPVAAVDAFRAGDTYEGTKQLLGEEQWKRLSAAGMLVEEVIEIASKAFSALGN